MPGVGPRETQQREQGTGRRAINVQGDGNCVYWGIVEAATRQQIPRKRYRTGDSPFEPYKRAGHKYYLSAEFDTLRSHPDFSNLFMHLSSADDTTTLAEDADIQDHFFNANRPASIAVCQVLALELHVDIHIQNLSHLDESPTVLLGGLPNDEGGRPEIHLLLREGGLPIYDSNLVRLNGTSDGHFYLVHPQENGPARLQEPSGNGWGSGLNRP